jgi:hypothetical protein
MKPVAQHGVVVGFKRLDHHGNARGVEQALVSGVHKIGAGAEATQTCAVVRHVDVPSAVATRRVE